MRVLKDEKIHLLTKDEAREDMRECGVAESKPNQRHILCQKMKCVIDMS